MLTLEFRSKHGCAFVQPIDILRDLAMGVSAKTFLTYALGEQFSFK